MDAMPGFRRHVTQRNAKHHSASDFRFTKTSRKNLVTPELAARKYNRVVRFHKCRRRAGGIVERCVGLRRVTE